MPQHHENPTELLIVILGEDFVLHIKGNVFQVAGVSALPDPMRLWPRQRGIADAISDPEIERDAGQARPRRVHDVAQVR